MFQMAMLLTKDHEVVVRPDNRENNTKAASLLRQAADLGYADAMNGLGEMYRDPGSLGRGPNAKDQAKVWFKKAAQCLLFPSCTNLGELTYDEGRGSTRRTVDDKPELLAEGIRLFSNLAAAGGVYEAMTDLGMRRNTARASAKAWTWPPLVSQSR